MPGHDPVKTPEHYRFPNGTEVKHITQYLTFFRGSAVKYICRELIQVAAVATAWVEHIDRREAPRAAQ